jgi:hypothetical protein
MDAERLAFIAQGCTLMVKGHIAKVNQLGFFDLTDFPLHVSTIVPLNEESLGFQSPQIMTEKPAWINEKLHDVYAAEIEPFDWANYFYYRCSVFPKAIGCVLWGRHEDNIFILIKAEKYPPVCLLCDTLFKDVTYTPIEYFSAECALGFVLSELGIYDMETPQ